MVITFFIIFCTGLIIEKYGLDDWKKCLIHVVDFKLNNINSDLISNCGIASILNHTINIVTEIRFIIQIYGMV